MVDDSDVIVSKHHVSVAWNKVLAILFALLSALFATAWSVLSEAKKNDEIRDAELDLARQQMIDRIIKLESKVENQGEDRKLLHDLNDKMTKLGTQFDDYIGNDRHRRSE